MDIPVCTTNRINTPEKGEEILAAGKADMVSMARPLLADYQRRRLEQQRAACMQLTPLSAALSKGCSSVAPPSALGHAACVPSPTSPLLGAVLAPSTATLPSMAAAARSRPVRRLLDVPDLGNGVSTCRCASGSERRRSRTRRGAGVVEALEPSTGVSGAASLAVPPGGLRRRTAVKQASQCVGQGPARPSTRRWTWM